MPVKRDEIELVIGDPFQNCKLGRKENAEILTNIVGNNKDGFVLAINSEWGTGKSTFVKMWRQHLGNHHHRTLYFNAWENDLEDSVFVTLLSELKELQRGSKRRVKFEDLVSKSVPLAKALIPSLTKAVASTVLGTTATEILQATATGLTDVVSSEIEEYNSRKKSLKAFKSSLEKYIKQEQDHENPVVLIIDELDRCRPNYAVTVLEHIKHLFSVPGIVFVLAIDKTQLANAVRGVYGSDRIDGEEYLRRFIDLEFQLPDPDLNVLTEFLFEYFKFNQIITATPDQRQYPKLSLADAQSFAKNLFGYANLNLRKQEKLLAHYRIALSALPTAQIFLGNLILALLYLREYHRSKYDEIKSQEKGVGRVWHLLKEALPKGFEDPQGGDGNYVYVIALCCEMYNRSIQNHPIFVGHLAQHEPDHGGGYSYNIETEFDSLDNTNHFKHILQTFGRANTSLMEFNTFIGCIELTKQAD